MRGRIHGCKRGWSETAAWQCLAGVTSVPSGESREEAFPVERFISEEGRSLPPLKEVL